MAAAAAVGRIGADVDTPVPAHQVASRAGVARSVRGLRGSPSAGQVTWGPAKARHSSQRRPPAADEEGDEEGDEAVRRTSSWAVIAVERPARRCRLPGSRLLAQLP